MKIVILAEGKTEQAFKPILIKFLQSRLSGDMPKLDFHLYNGRIPTDKKLKREVENLLSGGYACDHVIALTDVYTGTTPPTFTDAADAKGKMRAWVGPEPRFHPHAAQHDFEAWLLPFWPNVQRIAGSRRAAPGGPPEAVNHGKPPAYRIKEIFELGDCRDSYIKPRDAARILRDSDLSVAVGQCPELKAFINTILRVCGREILP